jgi:exopolyphosphatase/guanosine-5'-triphosphate,3'-diphosphate pyrophosphatase
MKQPELLAALDLGTNSAHLVIARTRDGEHFEVVTRHKETVRLGESGSDNIEELSEAAIDRTLDALVRCAALIESSHAAYRAVATSATREARNGRQFIDQIRQLTGLDVDVISGHEEARLIYLGVGQAIPFQGQQNLVCDIGGGSTELVLGAGAEPASVRSLRLGAIRTTQRFFPNGVTSKKAIRHARAWVRDQLAPWAAESLTTPPERFIATSGTAAMLFAMARARRGVGEVLRSGDEISAEELRTVIDELLRATTPEDRVALPGLETRRADIITGGSVILEAVTDLAGASSWVYSDAALREGVLVDLATEFFPREFLARSDIRHVSVRRLVESCDEAPRHSFHVADLAVELFDQLRPLHGYGRDERELLWAGAALANVGLSVAHSRHHVHSYYIVKHSDLLRGFGTQEVEVIANIARYHRRGEPSAKHAGFASLGARDRRRVQVLAGIARVAVGCDRSYRQAVVGVDVELTQKEIRLRLRSESADSLDIERFAVAERSGLLASALDRHIEVVAD